jgi:hypothetical protein
MKSLQASYLKQVGNWSTDLGWQEKVQRFDSEEFEKRRKKCEAEIERMNDTHATLASNMLLMAVKQIRELIEQEKFGASAAVALFEKASNLERLARGAASEMVQNTTVQSGSLDINLITIDVSKLSFEQLLVLETITKDSENK